MQTFLPDQNWYASARMLDNKRLGKQRVEALQILNTLRGKSKGWRNHPAVLMWYGYEKALEAYHDVMILEWISRGFRNNMTLMKPGDFSHIEWPHWCWERKVFASHRSNLLRKDPEFYAKWNWSEPPDLPYFWPVTKEEVALKRVLEVCA